MFWCSQNLWCLVMENKCIVAKCIVPALWCHILLLLLDYTASWIQQQLELKSIFFLIIMWCNMYVCIDFRFELHVFPVQCISHSSTFLGKRCGSRLIILFQKRTIQTFLLTLLCVQPMSPLIAAMGVNLWIALFWIESTLSKCLNPHISLP